MFNEIKDYEDEIAGKTRETVSGEFEDLDDLKDKFPRLKEIMIKNIENLGLELEARKGFEFEVDQVWLLTQSLTCFFITENRRFA